MKHVALVPCNTKPCILYRGRSTELQISFTARQHEDDLTDVCHGKVGFWVPFRLEKNHACKDQGVCPINAGRSAVYKYGIHVASTYPSVSFNVM